MEKQFIAWTPENIIKLRTNMKLTQFGLADAVRINCQNIKFWETNQRKPGLDSMAKMGKFFGVFFYAEWMTPIVGKDGNKNKHNV